MDGVLSPLVMSAFVEGLGWNSLYAVMIFVPVALAIRGVGPERASFRLALWSLVFARLVLPPDLAHRWGVGTLVSTVRDAGPVEGVVHGGAGGDMATAFLGGGIPTSVGGHESMQIPWLLIAVVCWAIGCALCILVRRAQRRPFHSALAEATDVESRSVSALADLWRDQLGIRRRVRLLTGAASVPPFTVGILRPVVYLPAPVVSSPRALEPAIAHELAHVARFDAFWLGLQHVVHAIYFFHPLAWFCGARLDEERERLCDQTVLAVGRVSARHYAGGLLDVLRLNLQGVGAPTMSARKRRIGVRIRSILDRQDGRRPRLAVAIIVVWGVGVFVLPMAAISADQPQLKPLAPVREAPPAPPAPSAPVAVSAPAAEVAPVAPPAAPAPPTPPVRLMVLDNPLPGGRVTWSWGPGLSPFSGEKIFHRGIDVAAAAGTPVLAPADGEVVVATNAYEPSPASGTVVIVRHNPGTETFYAHLGSLEVHEGQRVSRGDVIARVGSTGKSTGPHLHFEVRFDGSAHDPAYYVTDWH